MRGSARRVAAAATLLLLLSACAGGSDHVTPETWVAFDVRPTGEATVTIDRSGRPAQVIPVPGNMFEPGPAPVLVVNPASVGRPGSRAVEVCLPVVDVDVTVTRGPAPIATQGCWVMAADQTATFTLHPEPWRLPLGVAGVALAVGLAVVGLRRGRRWAAASLAAAVLIGLAASHAETAATVAGAFGGAGVIRPLSWLARVGWCAAIAIAVVGLVRATAAPQPALD